MSDEPTSNSVTTPPAPKASLGPLGRAFEFFSMRRGLAAAKEHVFDASDDGFAEYEFGSRALADAHQLATSAEGQESALLLYRSAIRLLASAASLASGAPRESAPGDPAVQLRQSAAFQSLPAVTQSRATGWLDAAVLSDSGEAYLSALHPSERELTLGVLREFAQRLAEPLAFDATRVSRLGTSRLLRTGIPLLFIVVAVIAWLSMLRPTQNLALHKSVVVSERDPQYGVDPSQVVDGDEFNLGFHTPDHPNTTVTIDLGSELPVARVEVFNRTDCCQERAFPIDLQFSNDGVRFHTVASKKEPFQQWTAKMKKRTRVRFVRLLHPGALPFHLAEIEVF